MSSTEQSVVIVLRHLHAARRHKPPINVTVKRKTIFCPSYQGCELINSCTTAGFTGEEFDFLPHLKTARRGGGQQRCGSDVGGCCSHLLNHIQSALAARTLISSIRKVLFVLKPEHST